MKVRNLICMFGLLLAGCAGTTPEPVDPNGFRNFRLGLISGAQEFVDFVMENHGMLDQFRLKAEKAKSLSPANLHLMVAEQKVDIGFAGFTTMATARNEGKDIIVIHGVFSPVNMVFVRKGSPIHTLSDLRGKKLGIFGGPGSTTFTFLAVLARKWHNLDLFKDAELVTAPAPALIELLDRGDVDAALLGTTESIKMFAEDRFQVLVDLSDEYRMRTNGPAPAHVTIATSRSFADSHADIVRDYLAAYEAAVAYAESHPEVWTEYLKTIEITSPREVDLFREKMAPNLVSVWDAQQINVQKEYLGLVHDIVGDSVLARIPDDLIHDEYNP